MICGQDIVCLASADFDAPSWLNVQHLMSRLAQAGNRILYVESLGLRVPNLAHAPDLKKVGRRLRRLMAGLRQPQPNLFVLAPRVFPGQSPALLRRLNQRLLVGQIRSAMDRLGLRNPILWSFLPTGWPAVHQLGESRLIYHCVDDYLANPGVPVEILKKLEDQMVAAADAIIVTAPRLVDKFLGRARRLALVPSGVDISRFETAGGLAEPADLAGLPHPRIGFIGNLTGYKVDLDMLEAVIRQRPDWSFVLIGAVGGGDPSTQAAGVRRHPNVRWLGEKPYSAIPAYLAHLDAGLIPYRRSAATEAVFPIKLFEYLAAGLPVVSTPLPSLEAYRDVCQLAADAPSFVAALDRALRAPQVGADERRALARRNSWDARLEQVSEFLAPLLSAASGVPPHG